MDSKITRSFKTKRQLNNPKPEQPSLKKQTSKIQNKLEFLKAEIAMRKTMKNKQKQTQTTNLKTTQKNNTGQSWNNINTNKTNINKVTSQNNNEKINKFLLGNTKQNFNEIQVEEDRQKLQSLLTQLKMDQYIQVIVQKYEVNGLQKLLQLTQQDIDKWKNIPVGFRVKIRKIINQHNKHNLQQNLKLEQKEQIQQKQRQEKNQKKQQQDIEMIIKRRKNQRIYQPICDIQIQQEQPQQIQRIQEDLQQNNPSKIQNQQDQQDILISSLNSAFLQRRGIIKKQGSLHDSPNRSQNKMKVHWDSKVKQYNKQTSKFKGQNQQTKYPKLENGQQINNKEIEMEMEMKMGIDKQQGYGLQANKIQYCWNCLKRIQIKNRQEDVNNKNHVFCSIKCLNCYGSLLKSPNKYKLQSQLNKQKATLQFKIQNQPDCQQQQYQKQQQQEEQELDIDIDFNLDL